MRRQGLTAAQTSAGTRAVTGGLRTLLKKSIGVHCAVNPTPGCGKAANAGPRSTADSTLTVDPTSVTMQVTVTDRDGHMRITGYRLGRRRGGADGAGHGQLAKLQREPECEPVRHGGPARLTKPGGLSLPGDCHHDDDSGLPGNQPGPLNQAVRIYSLTGRLALRLARQVHSRSQDPAVLDVPVEQWL